MACFSSATKGPGEEGAPRNHPEISFRKWPISSADLPMTPMERTDHHFGPFLGRRIWGNIRRPLLLPAPLFYQSPQDLLQSRCQPSLDQGSPVARPSRVQESGHAMGYEEGKRARIDVQHGLTLLFLLSFLLFCSL